MAITNILYQPKRWSSAWNPIVWSVLSDKNNQTDMKYVFDISINGSTGGTGYNYRIKQRPNPSGYGMIDVSTFAQSSINLALYNPELVSTRYSKQQDLLPFVHVKVGEEYLASGSPTMFNGSGVTGPPSFYLSPMGATGAVVRAIPSALDYYTQNYIMGITGSSAMPGSKAQFTITFTKIGTDWSTVNQQILSATKTGGVTLSVTIPFSTNTYTFADDYYYAEVDPLLAASNWATYFDFDTSGVDGSNIVVVFTAKDNGTFYNLTSISAGAPDPFDMINFSGYVNGTDTVSPNPLWGDYIMDGDGKFLSNQVGVRKIRKTDRHTLSFLNQWDSASPTYAASILAIVVKGYNSAGTLISNTTYYNTTAEGGGPQTNNTYTVVTEDRTCDLLSFRCGPIDLALDGSVKTYTVQAYYKGDLSTTPTFVASEMVNFEIYEDCQDLYKNVRVSWLNSLGGRDYFNFNMFYEKTIKSTSFVYNQPTLNWSASTPISNGAYENSFMRGGDKVYNKSTTSEITFQTDWLVQEEVDYLAEISQSPNVWCYIGDDYNTPYTLVITNTDYTYKNVLQQKLVQAEYTARLTKIDIRQSC